MGGEHTEPATMEWLRRITTEEDYHRFEMSFAVALVGLVSVVMVVVLTSILPGYENCYAMRH
jgi:hypothetical protein